MASDMLEEGLIDEDTALLRVDANRLEELFKRRVEGRRRHADREGPERLARRRHGRGRVHAPTRPRSGRSAASKVDPGAPRDHARRLPRHDRVAGHPDERRRDELARGGRGARRGDPGGLRRRRDQARPRGAVVHRERDDREGGRRRSRSTASPATSTWASCRSRSRVLEKARAGRRRGPRGEDLEGVRAPDGASRTSAGVCASARTPTRPTSPTNARERGAEGIGLCRTEHMFLGEERVDAVRQMIFAETGRGGAGRVRRAAAAAARATSSGSSRRWTGCPVTVRLLDPPLHEFLPDQVDARRRGRARARSAGTDVGAGARSGILAEGRTSSTRRTRCSACAACASGS